MASPEGFCGVFIRGNIKKLILPSLKASGKREGERLISAARTVGRGAVELRPILDVEPENQRAVGPLSAAVVELLLTEREDRALAAAQALRIVLRFDYFWIKGNPENHGIATTVGRLLSARSPEEASVEFVKIVMLDI